MVDRLDQVFIGFLSPLSIAFITLFHTWESTKGPFLIERGTVTLHKNYYYFPLLLILNFSVLLLLRVRKPFVGCPQGETG